MAIVCASTISDSCVEVAEEDRQIVALCSEAAETSRSVVPSLTETATADIRAMASESADVSQKEGVNSSAISQL